MSAPVAPIAQNNAQLHDARRQAGQMLAAFGCKPMVYWLRATASGFQVDFMRGGKTVPVRVTATEEDIRAALDQHMARAGGCVGDHNWL